MDVLDRLPGLRAGVENHPVSGVGDALRNGHLPGVGDQVREQVIPGHTELGQVRVVVARDYQDMNRRLRIYVTKSDCPGIRGHYRRRYLASRDTTEQAIGHEGILTSGPARRSSTYMVAMLRTRDAAPLCRALPVSLFCAAQGPVLRTCSRMAGWGVGGNGSGCGSHAWRRVVATFANARE